MGKTALLRVPTEVTDWGQAQSKGSGYFPEPQFPRVSNGEETTYLKMELNRCNVFSGKLKSCPRSALLLPIVEGEESDASTEQGTGVR